MKAMLSLGVAMLITGSVAQQAGTKRTPLQQHDLSVPGREAVQVLVAFAPGVVAPRHSHPGEEIVYAIEGLLEYRLEGKPPVTLKPGEVLFVPAGTVQRMSAAATRRSSPRMLSKKASPSSCW